MNIQTARSEDVKEIASLVISLSHFYLPQNKSLGHLLPDSILPDWLLDNLTENQFLQRINSSGFSNHVYKINDEIVGYVSMKEGSHLYHLFVSELYQGKGIAHALWKYICEQCPAEKYTLRSSLYAVPVYKKWGFVETGIVQEKDGLKFQAMELINLS